MLPGDSMRSTSFAYESLMETVQSATVRDTGQSPIWLHRIARWLDSPAHRSSTTSGRPIVAGNTSHETVEVSAHPQSTSTQSHGRTTGFTAWDHRRIAVLALVVSAVVLTTRIFTIYLR